MLDNIKNMLPELPHKRLQRYIHSYGLSEADAKIIVNQKRVSDFFEDAMKTYAAPKSLANFIIGELMRRINLGEVTMETLPFSASEFAKLVEMADTEKVSKNDAKKILRVMVETGEDAESIAKKQGMLIVNDLAKAKEQIAAILSANETAVVQYQNGEQKVFGFLMGQCTKALRGICTPKVIKETLEAALKQPVAA